MSCGTWEAAAGAAVGQTSSAHPRSCGCATEQRPQRGRVTAVRGEQRRRAHAAAACETGGRGGSGAAQHGWNAAHAWGSTAEVKLRLCEGIHKNY